MASELTNHPNTSQQASLEFTRQLVKVDFEQVNQLILNHLDSPILQIRTAAEHIISSGGKRLRPLLTLLSAKISQYAGDTHIKLAAMIEYIHTATLLHDDVVDMSSLRRGQPTANTIWGNSFSVLVGDFLYSRAMQVLSQVGNLDIIEVIAQTTNVIAQGEVLQLVNRHNPEVSEAHYFEVIRCKTAILFAAATKIGAMIANSPAVEIQALYEYGLNLGMGFQMIDDCLDYAVSSTQSGKNLGDDLAEGKVTLPLLYAMQQGTPQEAKLIREAVKQGGLEDFKVILTIMKTTRAFNYVHTCATRYIQLAETALAIFPDSDYKRGLLEIAQFAINRNV